MFSSEKGLVLTASARVAAEISLHPGQWSVLRGESPYPWQFDVMEAMGPDGAAVCLRTCNESGKTAFVIANLIIWHAETFLGSLTITTSASYGQIINQLYPSLRSKTRGRAGWKVHKDSAEYEPTGSRLVSFSTDDAGRAEGYHAPPKMDTFAMPGVSGSPLKEWGVDDAMWTKVQARSTGSLMIVVDEAKSVKDFVYDGLERCHPTRLLVASSPGAAEGKFWDFWNRERARFSYMRHVSYEECPHLVESPRHMREKEQQEKTLPDWLVKSMWYGEFAAISERGVFDMIKVDAAMSGVLPAWGRGSKRAAFDPSGGGDECPLYYRDGNDCRLVKSWKGERDDEKLANELIREFVRLQLKPEMIVADDGGLGKLLLNNLARKGWPVCRIDFGGTARNERYYRNTRAEMYCELANRVKKDEVRLPFDTELREQLGWQKRESNESPIKLIPKDKMPHSPDRADTVAMLFYDMPEASAYEDRRRQLAVNVSPTRSYENMFDPVDDYEYGSLLNW